MLYTNLIKISYTLSQKWSESLHIQAKPLTAETDPTVYVWLLFTYIQSKNQTSLHMLLVSYAPYSNCGNVYNRGTVTSWKVERFLLMHDRSSNMSCYLLYSIYKFVYHLFLNNCIIYNIYINVFTATLLINITFFLTEWLKTNV